MLGQVGEGRLSGPSTLPSLGASRLGAVGATGEARG